MVIRKIMVKKNENVRWQKPEYVETGFGQRKPKPHLYF